MKLSTRTRYGSRILLELALHYGEGPIPLKEIANKQQISLSYLGHLITPLISGGVMRSTKGSRGGVYLARHPNEIKLSEVMGLLEGSMALVECVVDSEICERSVFCITRDVWSELKVAMDGVLESTTLEDLVERHRKKEQQEPSMYYI